MRPLAPWLARVTLSLAALLPGSVALPAGPVDAAKPASDPAPGVQRDPDDEIAHQFGSALVAWAAIGGGSADEAAYRILYAKYAGLRKAGRFAQARDTVRILLAIRTREFGEDYYETRSTQSLLKTLEHVAALPDTARAEYLETFKLYEELAALEKQGKYPQAIQLSRRILDTLRRLLRPDDVAVDVNHHATLLYAATRYTEAASLFREALQTSRRVVGTDHPATAAVGGNLAMTLDKLDRYSEARPLYEEAVETYTRLWGKGHPSTFQAHNNLASHLNIQGRYAEVEHLHREVLETMCRAEGPDGPRALIARSNLATNLNSQGRYVEAERLYREALLGHLEPSGEKYLAAAASTPAQLALRLRRQSHPDVGMALRNLAVTLDNQGRYAEAEPLYRRALTTLQAIDGQSTLAAMTCDRLAGNLHNQGKYEEAESLYERSLRTYLRATGGKKNREIARVLNNRAVNLQSQQKLTDAQKMSEEALTIFRDLFGRYHPDVAAGCNNLASTLSARGNHSEAESLYREAVAIYRKTLGVGHPHTTDARINLAVYLKHRGRYAEAETELEAALELHRRLLGEAHPNTASAYRTVVANYCARGEYAKAESLSAAATDSFEAARLRISFAGLGRAGRAAEMSPLPALAVASARRGEPAAAWRALERDLARGLLDDLAARPLSEEDRGREQMLLARAHVLEKQIDLLRDRGAAADAERKTAEVDRDAALAQLVQFQEELATRYGVAAGRVYDLARIQKQIPEGAALLAWIDLPAEPGWADPRGDHWACLVRHEGDPVWVQLTGSGTGGAWTDEDERLAVRARQAFSARPDNPRAGWRTLVDRLTEQRLKPLEKHLKTIRHLVVLPSAGMSGVPVEALTDRAVSYAPSGTMFAWLREKPRGPALASLLALGNPAFRPVADGGPVPLPGTELELLGAARVFPASKRVLTGSEANESDLDELARNDRLRDYRYLHFATHGVLDDQRPMRSALLLAQDRLPGSVNQVFDGNGASDGRLTAERILRHWAGRLDAELVTLSACQTGLGRYSGGEGYVGFSQALFVAGARSLVVSLWEVDDASTALLMTRFYENLMGLPAGAPGGPAPPKGSKVEALAEAKRWLRGLKPEEVEQLRKDLPRQGTRGRVVKKTAVAKALPSYDHPYYWSGFVLVGDPK